MPSIRNKERGATMMTRVSGTSMIAALAALSSAAALAAAPAMKKEAPMNTPVLDHYTKGTLDGVWKRPGLSMRDRSIVTVAVLIARNQAAGLPRYLGLALDSGVKPAELDEIVAHLAFYSGWGNAVAADQAIAGVYAQRRIKTTDAGARAARLKLDETAEQQRASMVDNTFGAVSPGVVQYTTDALFRDLWLRPGLAPRDRSLVTVSALVASGQVAQVTFHLNRAMDNGLTQDEAGEALTQLAFYAGWPNVFSAMPVFKEVFASRAKKD